jgi:hypothetical protein
LVLRQIFRRRHAKRAIRPYAEELCSSDLFHSLCEVLFGFRDFAAMSAAANSDSEIPLGFNVFLSRIRCSLWICLCSAATQLRLRLHRWHAPHVVMFAGAIATRSSSLSTIGTDTMQPLASYRLPLMRFLQLKIRLRAIP